MAAGSLEHEDRHENAPGKRLRRGGLRAGRKLATVGVLAAMGALAACGGGGDGDGSDDAAPPSAGQPKAGGTLTFGEFSSPVGLDPIVMTGSGTTGLTESYAVYDSLLHYNKDTGDYEPGTAESVTANADNTAFTIKIRPGIKFTDGTDYNADAVAMSLNRFRSGQPGAPDCAEIVACPRNSTSSSFVATFIKDVAVSDPMTVTVTLKQSWAGFKSNLSSELGLVPSPTALKKCDVNAPINQCAFNTAPVGAGPFMVSSFKPGEGITMVRNPNYWDGQVYLDGLRFINLGDGGASKTYDALKTDQVQVAFLRDPETVAQARDAKQPGFVNETYGAQNLLMNNVATVATSNVKVRQAIAAAVDPNVVNQRAYGGAANAHSALLPESFRWYPGVAGPKYDPDKAKSLVAEAKAQGWDGRIRLLANNTPSGSNAGLAIQAMLQSAGIQVDLDNTKDIAGTTALLVKKDFDLTFSGMAAGNDESSEVQVSQNLLSTSPSNRVSFKDPAMDQAIAKLLAASSDADKKAAYGQIETILTDQVPLLPIISLNEYIAWSSDVHGVTPRIKTTATFAKAWID